jgi:acrylyl-CoA reductase (NADPH)
VSARSRSLFWPHGHEVAAVTGRPETEGYLRDLGASRIVPRADLAETVKRPLEAETWAGCMDAVGGAMLARVLGQMKYGASVAAVGLAGGSAYPRRSFRSCCGA